MSDLPTLAELRDPGLFAPPGVSAASHSPSTAQPIAAPGGSQASPAVFKRASHRPPAKREELTILVADAGGPNDPPLDVRLARALKVLGRMYRLRVKSIETGNLQVTPDVGAKI